MKPGRSSSITVNQVAAQAGVSTATVSRVISGSASVTADTEARVRAAIAELGYQPNRVARSLRSTTTRTIAIVLPGFHNPFFYDLIGQTVRTARDADYTTLVASADDPIDEAVRIAQSNIVDGIILVPYDEGATARPLDQIALPVVCFDRAPADFQSTVFRVDNEAGSYEVTKHLVEQGAQRIAHIAGPHQVEASGLRLRGYLRALDEAGLRAQEPDVIEGNFREESGARAMRALLDGNEDIDAVFAANDLMAIGAMSAAADAGVAVPGDVLVAGFDDVLPSRYTVPRLTTYSQPITKIARACVHHLIDRIESGARDARRRSILFPGRLVTRASSSSR